MYLKLSINKLKLKLSFAKLFVFSQFYKETQLVKNRKQVPIMMNVYYNGPIVTMEDAMPEAEILIEENGRIAYVGSRKGADIPDDATWLNLKGNTLMPAFIDGHGHFANTATFLQTVPLQSAESCEDITKLMQKAYDAQKGDDLKSLIGMGYDHNFLEGRVHPTKYDLDKVSIDIPIIVIHTSMHMAVANSKLLEMAGFTKDSEEIPGGVTARDPETNEPLGLLEEMAMHVALPHIGNIFSATDIDALDNAQKFYVENGVLTIQDGASNNGSISLVRELAASGRLDCDIVSYPCFTMDNAPDTIEKNKDCLNQYVDHFKIGGYKLVLDGSPQCKTAWVTAPYEGDGDNCGYPWITDEDVQKYVDQSLDDNLQLLCHCNGDASGDQFLNAYEKSLARFAEDAPQRGLRPVMIHCQTARNDQLDKMAAMNMLASIFVAHVNYWGDVHRENLGAERGPHISPVKDAMDRGICVNFHTDTPVTMPYMFHSVWTAVNRFTRGGNVLGADQAIDVWDALKAVTINAAYSYFEEDEKGSLKAGKKADLIVVDQNPLHVDKMTIKDIKVLSSIKEGKVLYQA